jgi:hypothetical protein
MLQCPINVNRAHRRPSRQARLRNGREAGPRAALGQRPLRRPADRRHGAERGQIAEMKTGEGKTLVATRRSI